MSKHILKRKAFAHSTNIAFQNSDQSLTNSSFSTEKMLPTLEAPTKSKIISEQQFSRNSQNVHPLLAWYKSDLETSHGSYEKFLELTDPDNERAMYDLLTQIGMIP